MRALMMQAVGKLEMVEIPDPVPAPGEVVVDVVAVGICGSDFHSARDGGLLRVPPIVMGHEFSGTVEGRRVTVDPMITCDSCSDCRRGLDNFCRQRTIIGIQRQGGFAERVAVPLNALVDLPGRVSFEAGALIEPLSVALHAVGLCEPERNWRVAILGAGTIGLMTTFLCKGFAADLHVADLDTKRLSMAKAMGAGTVTTQLDGEFDLIFDCAGAVSTHRESVARLKPGGTSVWIGNESPDPAYDAQALVRLQKRVIGSAAFTHRDFREAVKKIDNCMLEWTTQASLDEGVKAMYDLMKPAPGGPIKVILKP